MEQERSQMNPKDQWDLSTLYENDEAFEQDLARMDADTDAVVALRGSFVMRRRSQSFIRQ